ncbi:MAG: hypothetical protein L0Z07_05155, partial [Planctomycetes bacterium]|nr:hypothetical protein [Planctomycetota bacterium]
MSKWFYQAILHPRAGLKRFDRGYPAAIAIVGLVLGTCVALIPTNGQAESAAVVAEATADESTEDSLLVATREAPPVASEEANETTPTAGGEALEPIAESSGHSPEIAITDEEEQAATDFGAGLSQLTGKQAAARGLVAPQPSTEEPAPLAAKLAEPKSAPQNTGTDAATHARVPFEPARFNGIQVGKSTQSELVAAWGEPAESISTTDGSVLTYHPKPFEAVEILVSPEELVTAIKILLSGTIEPKALA